MRQLTYTIADISNKLRTPSLHAIIKEGEDIVTQAVAIKYKDHSIYGKNIVIIEELAGDMQWDAIRLLVKKLQSEIRTVFPGTQILLDTTHLAGFTEGLKEAGAKDMSSSTLDITILSPLF